MANPNPVDGAAARLPADVDVDEAMEVDARVTEMWNTALMYSRPTADDYSDSSAGNQGTLQRKEIFNSWEDLSRTA